MSDTSSRTGPPGLLGDQPVETRAGAWDEAVSHDGGSGRSRPAHEPLAHVLDPAGRPDLVRRAAGLARTHRDRGVTFRHDGADHAFHLDPVPRVLGAGEWSALAAGLVQRVRALEAFLGDVYGSQQVLRDGVVPTELVTSCPEFRPDLVGVVPPTGVRVHVAGIDVVRDGGGTLRVLEDNLRCPSGATYAVENRRAMQSGFPELFARGAVTPIGDHGALLRRVLLAAAGPHVADPVAVVLTPGPESPAWVEHRLLARWTGLPLVTDADLVVRGTSLFLRGGSDTGTGSDTGAGRGERRVHVVHRRVDDEDLDPLEPGGDPGHGVPGLMGAVRAGGVVLANAAGNGVADDKGVYTCVPDMVRYYLGEAPLLPNVETARCWVPEERADALDRMAELVFKPVQGYGGKGIVFGPRATVEELAVLRAQVLADPRGWVAQPLLDLSTVPTLVGDALVPRPVDLRPFVVNDGTRTTVAPAALTRVALAAGSLLVNSSQGGGSKDTWVLTDEADSPVVAVSPPARG